MAGLSLGLGIGASRGIAGGYGLSQALNRVFWRLAVAGPTVLGAISALLLTAALTAAFVPVHRVTRIDPQQALRHD